MPFASSCTWIDRRPPRRRTQRRLLRKAHRSLRQNRRQLQLEQVDELSARVLGRGNRVPDDAIVGEDLIVVAALKGLVAKEVDRLEAIVGHMLQGVPLVPPLGKDVKGDLSANGELEVPRGKLLLERRDHRLTNLVLQIVLFKLLAFLLRARATNRRHVQHPLAELDKRATLPRDVHLGQVSKDKIDELLQLLLPQLLHQRLLVDERAPLVRPKAILRERIVIVIQHTFTKLFTLLRKVTATHHANHDALTNRCHELLHFRRDFFAGSR
mmetsp:Transcript_7299/g.23350  ORF Transcript_7299/g.23350 Transcript_7299/m.23350 type:complete len:269 (+) Transcript_7299:567-1373(+)